MLNKSMVIKALTKQGFSGDEMLENVLAWMAENGVELFDADGAPIDIAAVFAVANEMPVEEVVSEEVEEVIEASMDDEMVEEEVLDKMDDEKVEEEVLEKSLTSNKEVFTVKSVKASPITSVIKSGKSQMINPRKQAYNQAAINKTRFGRNVPIFADYDQAEYVGATARLSLMHGKNYAQRLNDEAITKTGTTTGATYAAPLIVEQLAPEVIDALSDFGVTRLLLSVRNQANDVQEYARGITDPVFAVVNEAANITEGSMAYNRVQVTAQKRAALLAISSELLNDAAFSVADEIFSRFGRGLARSEDLALITDIHARISPVGGVLAQHNAGAANWGAIDADDIYSTIGKLSGRAQTGGNVKILCSPQFNATVLRRISAGAGGVTMGEITRGSGQNNTFEGYPVILSDLMPATWSAGSTLAGFPMYVGDFDLGCKFGVVTNSTQMTSSVDAGFVADEVLFRAVSRFGVTSHDVGVNATAVSNITAVAGLRNNT